MKQSSVQFVVDKSGNATSVIVSVNDWKILNEKYEKLQKKLRVLLGIQEGIMEVKKSKNLLKKLPTLIEFLNEAKH